MYGWQFTEDGEIDVTAFERLRCAVDEDPAQALRWAFHKFDTNGDGCIDKKELMYVHTLLTI